MSIKRPEGTPVGRTFLLPLFNFAVVLTRSNTSALPRRYAQYTSFVRAYSKLKIVAKYLPLSCLKAMFLKKYYIVYPSTPTAGGAGTNRLLPLSKIKRPENNIFFGAFDG